jgi:hypothetical protein
MDLQEKLQQAFINAKPPKKTFNKYQSSFLNVNDIIISFKDAKINQFKDCISIHKDFILNKEIINAIEKYEVNDDAKSYLNLNVSNIKDILFFNKTKYEDPISLNYNYSGSICFDIIRYIENIETLNKRLVLKAKIININDIKEIQNLYDVLEMMD